jgi:succinate dehydrogenase / fumarate reductase flavoprotein subunit
LGAADYVRALTDRPAVSDDAVEAATKLALAPFDGPSNGATPENPYTLQLDLQDTMNELVGIIRTADEITDAMGKLDELRERFKNMQVQGDRLFNPGWHLAIDLRNMLLVSECVAKAAMERTESRGGHTRDDHPSMDADWRKTLLVCRADNDGAGDSVIPSVSVTREDQVPMRADLLELFEISELEKYFTDGELADHPERRS